MSIELDINILYQAINSNVNISLGKIKRNEKKKEFKFVSQLFEYDLEKKRLLIALPSSIDQEETEEIVLKKKDPLRIFFVYKGFRFVVHSTVLGLTKYRLASGVGTQALVIELPETLLDGERRNFFKVHTPPFVAKASIMARVTDDVPLPPDTNCEGVTYDLSGGGIAIMDGKDEPLPFELQDIIDIYMQLDDQMLHMEGHVLNKRMNPAGDRWVYGIEFILHHLHAGEMKRNVAKIMHYVMKRQREIIFR